MGELTPAQIKYVLFHLGHHLQITDELTHHFCFRKRTEKFDDCSGKIIFPLSEKNLEANNIFEIDRLPVLFPCLSRKDFFSFDQSGNLIFSHDLLKASFYLLSGYQEFENQNSRDRLNRFSFEDSIQCKLEFTHKPLVNYYFEVLISGIQDFCSQHGLLFNRRRVFRNFGFLLTHDIDVVDYYTYNYLGYKMKEILGVKKSGLSTATNIKLFFQAFLKCFQVLKKDNPYWNFDYLISLEKSNKLRSVFFFLDQGLKNHDARYAFEEKRMVSLFSFLQRENCEIGLHGTVRSIANEEIMRRSLRRLNLASRDKAVGIRQHRLLWDHPRTAEIQERIGFAYDCTLGFAAHEGFRNSYCSPFRLYSFEQDRMLDTWEFPLNVMDVTLFGYQKYTPTIAMDKCREILDEVQRFGGVFNLLWHNSFFDESLYPGVTNFYESLLKEIVTRTSENFIGKELVTLMENQSR